MTVKYFWHPEYPSPNYWDTRTPMFSGMPRFFNLYLDLNDKKIRVFLKKSKGKILDAGCGNGRFIACADVGVDFSKGMLKRAMSRYRDRSLIRASILHLPFKDKAFSVAFTVDVLLHIQPDRRNNALKELDRVACNAYNFLAEHRTVIPFIFEFIRSIPLKQLWLIIPYVTVFFAFPFDRLKKLKSDSTSRVLSKLTI
jgi:ubiquinone/menaquinone biosynthesis C-methylase UbiE